MFDTYESKPTTSRAQRWDGTAAGAAAIQRYVRDELPGLNAVLYIAPGSPHALRREDEFYPSFGGGATPGTVRAEAPAFLVIPTLEGDMRADVGDWIIRGLIDEVYPCKPEVFERKYQRPLTPLNDGEVRLQLRRGLRRFDMSLRMPYEATRLHAQFSIDEIVVRTLDAAFGKGE